MSTKSRLRRLALDEAWVQGYKARGQEGKTNPWDVHYKDAGPDTRVPDGMLAVAWADGYAWEGDRD